MGFKSKVNIRWLLAALSVFSLLLVILFALGLIGGGQKILPGRTAIVVKKAPANAKTVVIGKRSVANKQSWPGIVKSKTIAKIAPKFTARIISVNVDTGDKIKKGDIIAELDDRNLRSAYNESKASLTGAKALAERAQADWRRSRYLFEKQAITRADQDAAVANAKNRQAEVNEVLSAVEQARINLDEATLKAPFDGVVSERLKEAGDMGLPGDPVATLLRPDDLRLEVAVPNICMSRIEIGSQVRVIIDPFSDPINAIVDEIAPEIDKQTGTRLLKAKLPAKNNLKHGQFAWLEQSCEENELSLFIPMSAVRYYGQLETVEVVSDDQTIIRHIRTGKQQGDQIEVLSGLRAGETIITDVGSHLGPE